MVVLDLTHYFTELTKAIAKDEIDHLEKILNDKIATEYPHSLIKVYPDKIRVTQEQGREVFSTPTGEPYKTFRGVKIEVV